jgi:predicted component of type VI protein secretion system
MVLTLEVVGPEGDELGLARRKVFDTAGGTIGRLKSNTWTLAEGHVSGRHAVIRFRNGQFLIEDTSTNGTCLNSPATSSKRAVSIRSPPTI